MAFRLECLDFRVQLLLVCQMKILVFQGFEHPNFKVGLLLFQVFYFCLFGRQKIIVYGVDIKFDDQEILDGLLISELLEFLCNLVKLTLDTVPILF